MTDKKLVFTDIKKKKLSEIKSISDDIIKRNKQIQKLYQSRQKIRDELAMLLRKEYEKKGFCSNAIVTHKKLKTEHVIRVMFFDNEIEDMVLSVEPNVGVPNDGKPRYIKSRSVSEFTLS